MPIYAIKCEKCEKTNDFIRMSWNEFKEFLEKENCECGGKWIQIYDFCNLFRPSSSFGQAMGEEYAPGKVGW